MIFLKDENNPFKGARWPDVVGLNTVVARRTYHRCLRRGLGCSYCCSKRRLGKMLSTRIVAIVEEEDQSYYRSEKEWEVLLLQKI